MNTMQIISLFIGAAALIVIASVAFRKPNKYKSFTPKVAFHHEAATHGEHGKIIATHAKNKMKKQSIAFVFVGLEHPPIVTPDIVAYIWEQAMEQGYMPLELLTYGDAVDRRHIGLSEASHTVAQARVHSLNTATRVGAVVQ